ncbi:MAG: penicillin-binding transpeptidase domain-containing protein [Patulibacter sp.]
MIGPLDPGQLHRGGTPSPGQSQVIALRVAVIGAVLLGLFAIVFFRLWYLQVLSGNSLAAQAASNRKRTQPITAPRGEILDREGKVLVRNRRAQIVELAPNTLPSQEHVIAAEYGQRLTKWSAAISDKYSAKNFERWNAKGFPKQVLRQFPKPTIPALTDAEVLRAYSEEGEQVQLTQLRQRYSRLGRVLQLQPSEVRRRVINSLFLVPYAQIPLVKQAPDEVVEYIAENAELFPGVSTSQRYVRSYPRSETAAQIFGQVGANPIDEHTGKPSYRQYRQLPANAQVGLGGLEQQYDSYLRGQDGEVQSTVDAAGNVIGEPKLVEPKAGDKLQLTLDLGLTEQAMRSISANSKFNPGGLPAAAVALDPRNGAVLAMASNPSFNPAEFVRGVSEQRYLDFINESGGKPLFNRVIQGGYASGSTFKPVTAFAALANGKVTTTESVGDQGGYIELSGQKFWNAGHENYGPVDLQRALQVSSDTYFYTLGARLNSRKAPQPLQQWARKLGFGAPTGIDLPGEASGTIPDVAWRAALSEEEAECRRKAKPPIPLGPSYDVYAAAARGCGKSDMRSWSIGDNVQLAIGQGDVNVTPLQLAVLYAAIENGGKIVRPHLAGAILDRSGGTSQTFSFAARRTVDLASTGGLDAIRSGLFAAANEAGGTSAGVFGNWPQDRHPIFGKTGTAEKQNAQGGMDDYSWYAAYVPDAARPIVVAVVVEKGGFGAEKAAPIAGQMLAQWFHLTGKVEIVAGKSSTR